MHLPFVARTGLLVAMLIVPALPGFAASPTTREASTRPATGPAGPHALLIQEMIAFFDKVSAILGEVTDDASANAAVPKLQAAREEILKLRERTLELGPGEPSKEVREVLEKYRPSLETAWKRTAAEQERVRKDPALEKILGPHLDGLKVFQSTKVEAQ